MEKVFVDGLLNLQFKDVQMLCYNCMHVNLSLQTLVANEINYIHNYNN